MRATRIGTSLAVLTAVVTAGAAGTRSSAEAGAETARAACSIPVGGEKVRLNPADFTTRIDNP